MTDLLLHRTTVDGDSLKYNVEQKKLDRKYHILHNPIIIKFKTRQHQSRVVQVRTMASHPLKDFQQSTKHPPRFFSNLISHHNLLSGHSSHTAAVWARSCLRAFALTAPSTWNALPPGICLLISTPPSSLSFGFTFSTNSTLSTLLNTAACAFHHHYPNLLHGTWQLPNYYMLA